MKYIKLVITQTSKGIRSKGDYETFDKDTKTFKTLKEAKEFLKEEYEGHKKVKMYVDDSNGKQKQVGWIYCFRNKDWSHNSSWWNQQDWVEITEVEEKNISI